MLEHIINLPAPTLLLLVLGLGVGYLVLRFLCDPLRDIPGPVLARFTRLWYFLEIYRGSFEVTNVELHKRYGPIVRIAPNEYSIDDPSAAREIYGLGKDFIKAPWYFSWSPPLVARTSLFSDRDPVHHAGQRRKFASAYSMSSLVGYERFVDNCSSLITQRFSEIAARGTTINLFHWLQCYAFDVIGEITFADRFGFLDMGVDKEGVFEAIDSKNFYGALVGVFPSLHKIIFPWLPTKGGFNYVLEFSARTISSRQSKLKDPNNAGRDGPPDFTTKFIAVHESNPEKMTRADIAAICTSNIAAGSDTTAITLSSIFYHLMKYPATYQKLQEEVDTAAREGRISDPITFKEAQDLPYLQAVIKEALRFHSATGLPLSRIVPGSGVNLSGRDFPAGSTVGINAWVAHRNTSVYGSDADIWRPERWIEIEEQGRGADVERYFFAFGMGSRTCIGKNISLLEICKLVPQIVRRFDLKLSGAVEERDWKTKSMWFVKPMNFDARVFARVKESL